MGMNGIDNALEERQETGTATGKSKQAFRLFEESSVAKPCVLIVTAWENSRNKRLLSRCRGLNLAVRIVLRTELRLQDETNLLQQFKIFRSITMKSIRIATCFVSLTLTANLMAQPPQGEPGRFGGGFGFGGEGFRIPNPLLIAMDTDKDGNLSAEEIENAATALKTLDKNKDGRLDQAETRPNFEGMGRGPFGGEGDTSAAQMVERLMAMDANKDGKLSKEELPERMQSMMTRGDKNEDGVLDKEEIMASARERSGGGGPGFGGGTPGGGFGGGPEFVGQMLERADADKDGKLSKDELPPFMKDRLEQIDTNKDGSLDKAELQAGMARMREGGGERRDGNKGRRPQRPAFEESNGEKPKSEDSPKSE